MRELYYLLLVLALAAAAVFLVFLLGRSIYDARQAKWRKRYIGDDPEDESILAAAEPPAPRNVLERTDRWFDRLIGETGLGISSLQAVGIMALCAVILGGIPLILRFDYLLCALGVLAGVLLPLGYFAFERVRFRNKVQDQLPDAFFLMSRSLKAGQNIEQSMGTVATYGSQPLAGEFKRVVDQTELGLSVPAALQGMSKRLNQVEFNTLVTAVTLHRSVGGNLAQLLERVATAARDRNQFRGYFKAATSLGRITAFAIAAAPIILLIGYAIWQPEFIDRFTSSPTGIRALIIAGVLEVIGIVWILSLLRTDY